MTTSSARVVSRICAIGVTAIALGAVVEHHGRMQQTSDILGQLVADGHPLVDGRPRGRTIVEFADYQCPFCAQADARLESVLGDRAGPQIIFRFFPLETIHPFAFDAAVAAECAGEQHRFVSFHHALFHDQAAIGSRPWAEFANRAGVPDTGAFTACLRSPGARGVVNRDLHIAHQLGLTGTPAFVVGRHIYYGSVPESLLVSPSHAADAARSPRGMSEVRRALSRTSVARTRPRR